MAELFEVVLFGLESADFGVGCGFELLGVEGGFALAEPGADGFCFVGQLLALLAELCDVFSEVGNGSGVVRAERPAVVPGRVWYRVDTACGFVGFVESVRLVGSTGNLFDSSL